MTKLLKGNDKFFLFKLLYNSRIIKEYFQAKIGRKIGIFSLARKNNILIFKKMSRFTPSYVMIVWHQVSFGHLLIFFILNG